MHCISGFCSLTACKIFQQESAEELSCIYALTLGQRCEHIACEDLERWYAAGARPVSHACITIGRILLGHICMPVGTLALSRCKACQGMRYFLRLDIAGLPKAPGHRHHCGRTLHARLQLLCIRLLSKVWRMGLFPSMSGSSCMARHARVSYTSSLLVNASHVLLLLHGSCKYDIATVPCFCMQRSISALRGTGCLLPESLCASICACLE